MNEAFWSTPVGLGTSPVPKSILFAVWTLFVWMK